MPKLEPNPAARGQIYAVISSNPHYTAPLILALTFDRQEAVDRAAPHGWQVAALTLVYDGQAVTQEPT